MFISIINDTFNAVRNDADKQSDNYQMVKFMYNKLQRFFGVRGESDNCVRNPIFDANNKIYKDQFIHFPEKIDDLLFTLSEV